MSNYLLVKNMKIPENIRINSLHLSIQNLERSLAFYTDVIGLQLLMRDAESASLGVHETQLLVLHENPDARQVRNTSGLYHFAILVPTRSDLAVVVARLLEKRAPIQGFAHHGVSEAVYLSDPDGNGIEIYRDLSQDDWPRDASGELQMVTDPLDVKGLLAAMDADAPANGMLPPDATIGHMHLHVRNVDEAVAFYRDALGFNLIQRYGPSAAFLAAGDYHHHIGINTWAGIGAPPKPDDAIGLESFSIVFPADSELSAFAAGLREQGVGLVEYDGGVAVKDPSGNLLRFVV